MSVLISFGLLLSVVSGLVSIDDIVTPIESSDVANNGTTIMNGSTVNEVCLYSSTDRMLSLLYSRCLPTLDDRCYDEEFDVFRHGIRYRCSQPDFFTNENMENVSIIDSSQMFKLLNKRDTYGRSWCVISLFFAPGCPFSHRLAPYFNALPKLFPSLKAVAIDATDFSKLNSRYGITGTPTVILWVNGVGVARMEERPLALEGLKAFITQWTDLEARPSVPQTADGPVIIDVDENSQMRLLIVSWSTVVLGLLYYVSTSPVGQRIVNFVRDLRPPSVPQTADGPVIIDVDENSQMRLLIVSWSTVVLGLLYYVSTSPVGQRIVNFVRDLRP